MGNAATRKSRDGEAAPSTVPHRNPLRRRAIEEEDAFAIAMAWCEQLRLHVALETDPLHDEFAMVKSYEWIRFRFKANGDSELAACARAATTAWFWLSCCGGYSGRENPQFWKRVFDELTRPKSQSKPGEKKKKSWRERKKNKPPSDDRDTSSVVLEDFSITDAIRFFDHRERVFPRVILDTTDSEARQVFFGLQRSSINPKREDKLRSILQQLQPFLIASRLDRSVHIKVLQRFSASTQWSTIVDPAEIEAMNASIPSKMMQLRLELHSIQSWTGKTLTAETQRAVFSHALVEFPSVFFGTHLEYQSRTQTALQLRMLFRLSSSDDVLGGVHTLDMSQPHVLNDGENTKQYIRAVCSVLPHSRSIHTLRYVPGPHPSWTSPLIHAFDRMDWAWLGYALFHPDSSDSAWTNLDVYLTNLTSQAVQVLELMACGNNFLSVGFDEATSASRFYHTAQVGEGAEIRLGPSDDSDVLLEIQDFLSVTLCVNDISSLETWIRVVVPGLGFGWIRSSTVEKIVSRPPASCRLETLRMKSDAWTKTENVVSLLFSIGANLTNLDLADTDLTEPELSQLLSSCPKLKSLHVQHSGFLWCREKGETTAERPPLEELSLTLPSGCFYFPRLEAVRGSLRNLTALRITIDNSHAFPFYRHKMASLLAALPTLRYLHWFQKASRAGNIKHHNGKFPYVDGLARCHKALTQSTTTTTDPYSLPSLPRTDSHKLLSESQLHAFYWCEVAHFSTNDRLAFLSAVRRKHSDLPAAAMGRLGRDVIQQIFAFATSVARRDLWIGG